MNRVLPTLLSCVVTIQRFKKLNLKLKQCILSPVLTLYSSSNIKTHQLSPCQKYKPTPYSYLNHHHFKD